MFDFKEEEGGGDGHEGGHEGIDETAKGMIGALLKAATLTGLCQSCFLLAVAGAIVNFTAFVLSKDGAGTQEEMIERIILVVRKVALSYERKPEDDTE